MYEDKFLSQIARPVILANEGQAEPAAPSEYERYINLQHGIMDRDALQNPLLWWKVINYFYNLLRELTPYRPGSST